MLYRALGQSGLSGHVAQRAHCGPQCDTRVVSTPVPFGPQSWLCKDPYRERPLPDKVNPTVPLFTLDWVSVALNKAPPATPQVANPPSAAPQAPLPPPPGHHVPPRRASSLAFTAHALSRARVAPGDPWRVMRGCASTVYYPTQPLPSLPLERVPGACRAMLMNLGWKTYAWNGPAGQCGFACAWYVGVR